MARKRRGFFKRAARRAYGGVKRYARRYKKTGGFGNLFQPDAMVYGAVRAKTSDMLMPLVSQSPLGNLGGLADELTMGALCWLAAKNTGGFIQKVAQKGLVIENARVGEFAASGLFKGNGSTSTGQTVY